MSEPSAQQIAHFVGDGMYAKDRAAQDMGIRLSSIAPGRAEMTMTVRENMLNGLDSCHGGYIAALADTAFAYACNSHNEATVASGFSIDFAAPAKLGDVLIATAVEVVKAGRTGIYDTDVINQRGQRIAVFRGRSYTLKGKPTVSAETII
ncbi:MAG: hydroxyphenylacetyl-CoA thioesterase PaaI [Burkholderiaceae bacterium]|jgi:acyl-CoA thioesterase|nr:hydroxyphenylacetyl-CoA thioesterase PaaI [Burkholderiaceae bacterium]